MKNNSKKIIPNNIYKNQQNLENFKKILMQDIMLKLYLKSFININGYFKIKYFYIVEKKDINKH